MSWEKLRQTIAVEAARLLVQRKAADLYSARKQAARNLTRKRLKPQELPSNSEIQAQLFEQSGVFREEREISRRLEIRLAALELMERLSAFPVRVTGDVLEEQISTGAEISLLLLAEKMFHVEHSLAGLALQCRHQTQETLGQVQLLGTLRGFHRFPVQIQVFDSEGLAPWHEDDPYTWDVAQLREILKTATPSNYDDTEPELDEEEYHPELFEVLRMYLQSLEKVRMNVKAHPEGDALYHSLQVFERGRQVRPYDEEFLLACLVHDVGYGLDRRNPQTALEYALRDLVTPRTWFLLEHQAEGHGYLTTGKMRRGCGKSEHREDLILLARCDLEGRLRGGEAPSLEEALEYLEELPHAWDDE
ncbi:MAG: hypothetical protein U0903_08970 [Planctomycetales bacterium]